MGPREIDAGGGITLRRFRASDAKALAALANDARIAANLRDRFPHPYTLDDARAFLRSVVTSKQQTTFAIVHGGRLAGSIGFVPGEDVERVGAEIGYWVGTAFWGKGIATAALRAFGLHLFDEQPELTRLFALPFTTNRASARVLEKAGYKREGRLRRSAKKNGVVLDQWMYALTRSSRGRSARSSRS